MAGIDAHSPLPSWRFDAVRSTSSGAIHITFTVSEVSASSSYLNENPDEALKQIAQSLAVDGWDLTKITKADTVETVILEPEIEPLPSPSEPGNGDEEDPDDPPTV
jgi:hypothetical protein